MIRFRTIIILCLTILAVAANQAVLLRDVTSITLYRGQQTTGRRSSPVPQLQCVGGTAAGKFSPKVVQCYNRGFDGRNPQWECTSELPIEYQFGKIAVSCEGYEFPEDPYILAGSCGLKYELDYSTSGARKGAYSTEKEGANYTNIIYFVCIAFVLYLLYLSFTSTRDGHEGNVGGTNYPGDGPGGNDQPPYPPGWRQNYQQPPPSYDETFKGTSRGNTGSSNFGFFSGLGLGGLGGYLLGNNWGRGNNHNEGTAYRRRGRTQFERDTGFYSDSYNQPSSSHHYDSPSSSGSTHTSSGFGGTERR